MKRFISLLRYNQYNIQSMILWVAALLNLNSVEFWFFAIPAIALGGLQDIINELRKLNNNK
jgi:hypothetical protein